MGAILLVAVVLAAATLTGCNAVQTANCYDFDGIPGSANTRSTAARCYGAANAAALYGGASYSNDSASNAVSRADTEAVFFHAGHSIIFPGKGIFALLFESPGAGGPNLSGITTNASSLGVIQVPLTICDENGANCRSDVLWQNYYYDMQIHNLVVLMECQSAWSGPTYTSQVANASSAGAGTVVGFSDLISWSTTPDSGSYGSGWANRFWSDVGSNIPYTTAVVNASNAVGNAYGYGSYSIAHKAGAPNTLAPANWYVN